MADEPLTDLEKMPGYPEVLDPEILAFECEGCDPTEDEPLHFDDCRKDKTEPDITRIDPERLKEIEPPTAKSIKMGEEILNDYYCDDDPRNQWLYEDDPPGPFISVVTRAEWGADKALKRKPMYPPVKHVRFTYTGTETDSYPVAIGIVKEIQEQHMKKDGLPDISYNFLIGEDGFLYEGRGWYVDADRPAELAHLKEDCLDIAYMGDFKDKDPPWIMIETAWDILRYGLQTEVIDPAYKVIQYRKK